MASVSYQVEGKNLLDVAAVVCGIGRFVAQLVDFGEFIFAFVGYPQHFLTFGVVEEFAFGVEQFQRIPLAGIVRGCEYEATLCVLGHYGYFGGRGGGKSYVDYVASDSLEGTAYEVAYHIAR